jgi:hypothetical protein
VVLLFARDPADNSLWDYAVREAGKSALSLTRTDSPLVRAA